MSKNDTKLVISINHNNPISLIDLTMGLNALASLYDNFTKDNKEARLLVKEIKKGSIIIDLITTSSVCAIPLISDVNNIVQFCHYIRLLVATCTKKNTTELEEISREHNLPNPTNKDLKNFGKSLNIVDGKNDVVQYTAENIKTGDIYISIVHLTGQNLLKCKKIFQELQVRKVHMYIQNSDLNGNKLIILTQKLEIKL